MGPCPCSHLPLSMASWCLTSNTSSKTTAVLFDRMILDRRKLERRVFNRRVVDNLASMMSRHNVEKGKSKRDSFSKICAKIG